ncbi:50S ribosomal protein L1 [bacterium]|nr:50S ribosomal protein L1 [bacterium]
MANKSKRLRESEKLVDKNKVYTVEEAVSILKKVPPVKFDETIEISFKLGVDPKHADQMVRGSVVLPHGTGKEKRVLVFAKGDVAKQAKEAGADYVGDQDLVDKILKGWFDFDAVIAVPDMMKDIAKLGRALGTRGLMPNPKTGTVTNDVAKATKELKSGKIDFKVNKAADINIAIGKISFDEKSIAENIKAIIDGVVKAKPVSSKGKYLKKISISATMGHGVSLDLSPFTV